MTTDATTMSVLPQTCGTTQSPSSTPGVLTTDGLATRAPAVPGYVLYAAGGFTGVICLLLVLMISVVSVYIYKRQKQRIHQYRCGHHTSVDPRKTMINSVCSHTTLQ